MSLKNTYISKIDFHNGEQFVKINEHIDTCLTLLEKLIKFNLDCKFEVNNIFNIENIIIDYRIEQFDFYNENLKSIYYSCYSLKHIYDTSTFMNLKGIENTIGETIENQRAYITITAIVKMSSIFEYTRKVYEKNITGSFYFEKLKIKYSDKVDSLQLLHNFRNTIHSNGKWYPKKKSDYLIYNLREGEQIIKTGDTFKYDYWKIYRIIKDCLELNKLMALDNEEERLRKTRLNIDGQTISVLKTDITIEGWNRTIKDSTNRK